MYMKQQTKRQRGDDFCRLPEVVFPDKGAVTDGTPGETAYANKFWKSVPGDSPSSTLRSHYKL